MLYSFGEFDKSKKLVAKAGCYINYETIMDSEDIVVEEGIVGGKI